MFVYLIFFIKRFVLLRKRMIDILVKNLLLIIVLNMLYDFIRRFVVLFFIRIWLKVFDEIRKRMDVILLKYWNYLVFCDFWLFILIILKGIFLMINLCFIIFFVVFFV